MSPEDYSSIIEDPTRISNCKERIGYYENKNVHIFTFDPTSIEWWKLMHNTTQDYVGHYDDELKKFTS